ncbi:MAG: ABC transporter permease [Burkholderiales bacterium]
MKLNHLALMLLLGSAVTSEAAGYKVCGDIYAKRYGPFDYTNPEHFRKKLPIVEQYHFTSNVENLISGSTGHLPGPDLSYTLNAFPNHHRALAAMTKLAIRQKTDKPQASNYTMECWFDRAVEWRPRDGMVRMLFGNYLSYGKRYKEALSQYLMAEDLLKNNTNLFYNMGLLYFNIKNYGKSLEYAKRAYAGGFPLPGLRNMLVKAGKWERK